MADDYMSDTFLNSLPDVRPGLVHGAGKSKLKQHKRHLAALQESKEKARERKTCAKDVLVKGLQHNIISEDNPGYKMMKMMGYKQGSGLGKEGEGRAEPVKIDPFKDGKSGLGKETQDMDRARKRVKFEQARLTAYKKNEAALLQQFRESKKEAAEHRELANCASKCRVVCSQLDHQHATQPPEPWYWPAPRPRPDDEEEEEVPEPDPAHILPLLTRYLRNTYWYCVWCGVKYTDTRDLQAHCPGETRLEHQHNNLLDDTDFAD